MLENDHETTVVRHSLDFPELASLVPDMEYVLAGRTIPGYTLIGVQRLMFAAATAVGTTGAVLVLCGAVGCEIALRLGLSSERFSAPAELLQAMLSTKGDLYVEHGALSLTGEALRKCSPDLRFVAATTVYESGARVGMLVICDLDAHPVSKAQEYVLRTMAAGIGDQLELHSLRKDRVERSTMESPIHERLRLLESVVVNANDAVLITEAEPIDLPGPRILYANAAFTRTTGYSLEEILGKTPRILQGPNTELGARRRLKAALTAWKPVEMELLNYRKDGTSFWVELSIVPVANETGWYTHWVSVQRDVSERKANEEAAIRFRLAEAHNHDLALEVKERKRIEAELAHMAFHDHVTGLHNRAYFMDRLKISIERASSRSQYRCAVLFLDLDNFKMVNDSLGHSFGDLLLLEVAQRLKNCTRPQDTIARIGGDEFTILCDELNDMSEVAAVAERILLQLRTPVRLAGNEIVATASIGISVGVSGDAERILRDADTAMYRAKKEGGAQFAVFNEEMHESARAALEIRMELKTAIDRGEFELHYQPLFDMPSGDICAVEALVRWRHPQRGVVSPLNFIGVAEETGLIVPLGSWILDEVFRHCATWRQQMALPADFKVSVNVSSRQLEDKGFLAVLQQALVEHAMDPRMLQLEITESVFMRNPGQIGALFKSIRKLGVSIAFDDFGTGYSSLSYLELYPIDTLKIDQSFVHRLGKKSANAEIVRMIVALAHTLRMDVWAEGVENKNQRDVLEACGCTIAQGFLFSRPVCFEDIMSLLQRETTKTLVGKGPERVSIDMVLAGAAIV